MTKEARNTNDETRGLRASSFRHSSFVIALRYLPVLVFLLLVGLFGVWDSRFLQWQNLTNILVQAAPIAILGIGMTFVLLTAGIDLSVGSIMYVSVVSFGVYMPNLSVPAAIAWCLAVGLAVGAVNAALVVRLRVAPFIVTLAMLTILRGVGRGITETLNISFDERVTDLGRTSYFGVPWSLCVLAVSIVVASVLLRRTPLGRQIYAVGNHAETATKAGISVGSVLAAAYCLCGLYAGLAGFVMLAQVGAAAPKFGSEMEFAAIAAAVLGGTSLFGGRGSEFGALFGAVLIKTVNNGLGMMNANEYVYPLVTAGLIFLAVLVDSGRNRLLIKLNRPRIRVE